MGRFAPRVYLRRQLLRLPLGCLFRHERDPAALRAQPSCLVAAHVEAAAEEATEVAVVVAAAAAVDSLQLAGGVKGLREDVYKQSFDSHLVNALCDDHDPHDQSHHPPDALPPDLSI